MATNNIKPFASNDTGTNLLTDSQYDSDAQRTIGHQPGVARAQLANKHARQTAIMASGLAQFVADNQAADVSDSDTPAGIGAKIKAALSALFYPKTGGVLNGNMDASGHDVRADHIYANAVVTVATDGFSSVSANNAAGSAGVTLGRAVNGTRGLLATGGLLDQKWLIQETPATGKAISDLLELDLQDPRSILRAGYVRDLRMCGYKSAQWTESGTATANLTWPEWVAKSGAYEEGAVFSVATHQSGKSYYSSFTVMYLVGNATVSAANADGDYVRIDDSGIHAATNAAGQAVQLARVVRIA